MAKLFLTISLVSLMIVAAIAHQSRRGHQHSVAVDDNSSSNGAPNAPPSRGPADNNQSGEPNGSNQRPNRGPRGSGSIENNGDADQHPGPASSENNGDVDPAENQHHVINPRPHHRPRPADDDDDESDEDDTDCTSRHRHRRHSRRQCACNRRRDDSDSDSDSDSDESDSNESWEPRRHHRRHSRRHGHRHGPSCNVPHGPWGSHEIPNEIPVWPQPVAPVEPYGPAAGGESMRRPWSPEPHAPSNSEEPAAEPTVSESGAEKPIARIFSANRPSGSSSGSGSTTSASGSTTRAPGSTTSAAPLTLTQITAAISSAVTTLLLQRSPSGASSVRLWDALKPYIEFPLLNQQAINALGFNVRDQVVAQTNDLAWNNLPANVRQTLFDQKKNNQIYDLTFCQLNIVEPPSTFCSRNLRSILPQCVQPALTSLINSLNSINFNTTYSNTGINSALTTLQPIFQQLGVPANAFTTDRSSQLSELRRVINGNQVPTPAQRDAALAQWVPTLANICPTSG